MSRGNDILTCGPGGVRVVIVPDARAAAQLVCERLVSTLLSPGERRIGLATGNTFRLFFDEVVRRVGEGNLDLSRAAFTHLDEFAGLGPADAGSMARELGEHLFERLEGPVGSFTPVDARDGGPEAHARFLEGFGPRHLQLVGIGGNGHVGFNEPGDDFGAGTHRVALAAETLEQQAPRFRGDTPTHAVTMGVRDILRSERLVMVALGAHKAEAVRLMLEAPVSESCPASIVRTHPDVLVILDPPAAAQLDAAVGAAPQPLPFSILTAADLAPKGPVVVCSPHPDDASISCGGLIASLPADTRSVILGMTSGARAKVKGVTDPAAVASLREDEVRAEAAVLGCEAEFLRGAYYDRGSFVPEDAARLAAMLDVIGPAWILAPSRHDSHPTHALTRHVVDDALLRRRQAGAEPVEVWTFEGPWYQHAREEINALVHYDAAAETRKIEAVKQHRSQVARVPFEVGAEALARLRGVGFSESHFGGATEQGLETVPLLEAFVRERY